jgi:hypothetical protein
MDMTRKYRVKFIKEVQAVSREQAICVAQESIKAQKPDAILTEIVHYSVADVVQRAESRRNA